MLRLRVKSELKLTDLFFFPSFLKEARSIKWDTFSSSYTHTHTQFSRKTRLIFFSMWAERSIFTLMFEINLVPPCQDGFSQNETIHSAFLIRLILSCTWSLLYWLAAVALAQVYLLSCGTIDYAAHICRGEKMWRELRAGARSAGSLVGAGGYGGW